MQQFTVPQFIDIEDKIIGPITTRQFIILLATMIVIAAYYKIFDFSAFVAASVLTFSITCVFAFFKINGRPFHFFVLNLIQTLKRPALRAWNKNYYDYNLLDEEKVLPMSDHKIEFQHIKKYSSSRLAELALMVDTRGEYAGRKENENIELVKRSE